jgi:predicted DNA-binding transcriptional regulator AlpA
MPICSEEVADPAPSADVDGQTRAHQRKKGKKRRPYKKPALAHPQIPRGGFRFTEWCASYGFSRSFFYELMKKKKGPKVTDINGIQIITVEDDNAWRRKQRSAASKKGATA